MIPSVYINLDDDVGKVAERLKRASSKQVILVCPKRCFLFSDSINLRLLKKQADLLGKEVFVLTMDERGQLYAQEAGFGLKFLPKAGGNRGVSDVRFRQPQKPQIPDATEQLKPQTPASSPIIGTVKQLGQIAKKFVPAKITVNSNEQPAAKLKKVEPPPISTADVLPAEPIEITDNVFATEQPVIRREPKKKTLQRVIIGIVVTSCLVILALLFLVLPRATVVVYPKTESITRDIDISLSANAQAPDVNNLVLPAQKIDQTFQEADQFQSSGKLEVGNKASGTIKIYNFTKVPISLKAATTVLVVGSKNYSLVNDIINLKPTVYLNVKTKEVDPASLGDSVQVVAQTGGDDYNLPAGTRMEISNQIFGSRPQILYAKTDTELAGGTTRYLSVINQSDVTAAEQQLQAKAVADLRDKLKQQGQVLADSAFVLTVSKFSTDNPIGTQTPSFNGSLECQITALVFKETDLTNLVETRVNQTIAGNKSLINDSTQLSYQAKTIDLNDQTGILSSHFEGKAQFNLDLSNVAQDLVGKTENQANEILNSRAEIEKVEITLAPVWQKNFPIRASKITIVKASS